MQKEGKVHFIVEPGDFIGFGSQRWGRDKNGVERIFLPVYLSVLAKPVEIVFDNETQLKDWCDDLIKDIKNLQP